MDSIPTINIDRHRHQINTDKTFALTILLIIITLSAHPSSSAPLYSPDVAAVAVVGFGVVGAAVALVVVIVVVVVVVVVVVTAACVAVAVAVVVVVVPSSSLSSLLPRLSSPPSCS